MTLEERFNLLELLFNNTEFNRFIYKDKLNKEQYKSHYETYVHHTQQNQCRRKRHHQDFESAIYKRIFQKDGDYHFCGLIAQLFTGEHS